MTYKKLRLSRRHVLFDLEEYVPFMYSWGMYSWGREFDKFDEDLGQLSSEISFTEQNDKYEKTFNE